MHKIGGLTCMYCGQVPELELLEGSGCVPAANRPWIRFEKALSSIFSGTRSSLLVYCMYLTNTVDP